jgi:quercetin dioxygenase-like cupin family protein
MKAMQLFDEIEFREKKPEAQPLYVDRNGRIIRFTLKPGQSIKEHNAPDSPFYVVVLKGKGMSAGADEKEGLFGPNSLLVFDPTENHSIRALDQELVFVGFLHGAPSNITQKVGGIIGRGTN